MSRNHRILMIDDDEKLTAVYSRQLRAAAYDVHVVNDASAAVRALQERAYDLAIVDMNLTGSPHDHSGGEAILAFLKTLNEPIAVVVLTSEEDPQFSADLVQDWGISRFVSKGTITRQGLSPLFAAVEMALASSATAERKKRPELLRTMMGSESEAFWVDMALRALSPDGGYPGLKSFLDGFLGALMPLLPIAHIKSPPLHASEGGTKLEGSFWSKGVGRPVQISLRSAKAATQLTPGTLPAGATVGEVLKEYTAAGVSGVVWVLEGCARNEFV